MRSVLDILEELQPGMDFKAGALVDDGILDSFDIVSLIGELNDEYGITIPMWEIMPQNLNSVEAIEDLVNRQKMK